MADGLLLVDKPSGMTSHDVVQAARRALGIRRIGHTGTLDPMARGLLVLLVGRATAHQQAFQRHDKTYEAAVRLGAQTDTADADGRVVRTAPVPPLDAEHVRAVLRQFEGALQQAPPAYSAVKVQGRPAYWWARRQRPVELAKRAVHVHELTLLGLTPDTLTLRVRCSAGTYVRALAESVAQELGTLGHLSGLVRLRIGAWTLDDAVPLTWIRTADRAAIESRIMPIEVPAAA
jgi:tRNA pseudouridine55 synthase